MESSMEAVDTPCEIWCHMRETLLLRNVSGKDMLE